MQKFKIIKNGVVLTCDPLNRGGRLDLLLREDRIVDITDKSGVFESLHPEAESIDATDKLILPGFVNAHFHGDSLLFRERTDTLHVAAWQDDELLNKAFALLSNPAGYDYMRSTYLAAYFACLKSGTTCVGEYGLPLNNEGFSLLLQTIARTDVRSVVTLRNWDQIRHVNGLRKEHLPVLINLGQEDSLTLYTLENASKEMKELNAPLLVHIAERREDAELIRKNFDKEIFHLLDQFDFVNQKTVFVHLNHISEADVALMRKHASTAVICPRSAANKSTGYPSLRHLVGQGVRLALGTDWGSVDMMREMQFYSKLPLLVSGFPRMNPLEIVRMATVSGAMALGVSSDVGSIEIGKCADLVFFALDDIRLPLLPNGYEPVHLADMVVNHLNSRDVSDVMINGEYFVKNRQIMTMSEEDLIAGFRTARDHIISPDMAPEGRPGNIRKPKVVPFLPAVKVDANSSESFENGLTFELPSATPRHERSVKGTSPDDEARPDTREPKKPELPKDARTTFGDDDI